MVRQFIWLLVALVALSIVALVIATPTRPLGWPGRRGIVSHGNPGGKRSTPPCPPAGESVFFVRGTGWGAGEKRRAEESFERRRELQQECRDARNRHRIARTATSRSL